MSPTRTSGRIRAARGYMLLVFVLFTAVLFIGVYRILPKAVFEGQRQKEEELIFRGQQYRRAIQLYVRKFGRYPASLDDLEDTNDLRFIRKLYPDPMTPDGEWRLIHIAAGGVFPDALKQPVVQGQVPGAANLTGESSGETGGQRSGGSSSGTSTGFQIGLSGASTGQTGGDITQQGTANPPNTQQPRGTGLNPQAGTPQQGPVFGGGGIAGVASQNESEAIKRWNTYTHYNEWEFIYDYRADPLGLAAINRVSGQQMPSANPQNPQGGPAGRRGAGPTGRPQQPNPFGFPGVPSAPGRPGGFPGVPPSAPFSTSPGVPPAPAQPTPGVGPR